jgi:hypothetical protein
MGKSICSDGDVKMRKQNMSSLLACDGWQRTFWVMDRTWAFLKAFDFKGNELVARARPFQKDFGRIRVELGLTRHRRLLYEDALYVPVSAWI